MGSFFYSASFGRIILKMIATMAAGTIPEPPKISWMPCGRWAHIFLYMGDSWIAPHRRDCTAQPYTCRSLRWERQKT